ncbi:hypothetical protein C7974DRAFT_435899 [Boeremia exigua]|uniref:uncharacterized protein n=1 Tax=Boeremia exigua TaxID=749465 RepID=UPI001E8D575E|nr:uncharacterized protein C7974DRAFT_435899 [Boeremia exigua]KAH6620592.1 hypothetical protein C7974DRAFT_435899 [Boeremia exigua]
MSSDTEDEEDAAIKTALYKRLELTEKEIREVCLVKILPGRAPGDIGVSIRNATPEDIGKYCCLSYECGPQDEDLLRNILIINESQGTSSPGAIGPNLYSFLEVAQNELSGSKAANLIDFHSEFWIDALSIDQDDTEVKNREVAKMGKIYAQASKTVIWLGHMGEPGHNWEAEHKNNRVKLLRTVDAQTYWNRAWIVQEVALAREPVILMGDCALPYDEIYDMGDSNGDLKIVSYVSMIKLVIMDGGTWPLTSILGLLSGHSCKLARDHIYSIRSLGDEYSAISIDYDTSNAKVIHQLFTAFPEQLFRQCSASHETQHNLLDAEWESTTEGSSQTVCQLEIIDFQLPSIQLIT